MTVQIGPFRKVTPGGKGLLDSRRGVGKGIPSRVVFDVHSEMVRECGESFNPLACVVLASFSEARSGMMHTVSLESRHVLGR